MSVIELIPLDEGNRLILDDKTVTTIGRTPNIGCIDKKISRNHAELYVKSDGTLWIKPIHHNPTFYRTKSKQLITLTKDQEHQLNNNDEIGLLPNEYFYRISIKSNNKEDEEIIEPSVIPKSPIKEQESSSIEEKKSSPVKEKERVLIKNHDDDESTSKDPSLEPEGGVILHTTRALPTWMANGATSEPKNVKGQGKGKATVTPTKASPSKYRTYIGRKKVEGIVYDDDDDDDDGEESNQTPTATPSTDKPSSTVMNSSKRERCPYGKFCYRKNPIHRQEAIHPGDPDWNDKENDAENKKPECPYGSDCYRKNPDHFNEYNHTKKTSSINKTKQRKSKRKGSDDDDEEDDDDGLPNEYDYNDSFIDDEEIDDSVRIDRAANSQNDPDADWKPYKKARHFDDDDDEDASSDESEIDLLKNEAVDFVQGSSIDQQRSAKKKARIQMPKDDE